MSRGISTENALRVPFVVGGVEEKGVGEEGNGWRKALDNLQGFSLFSSCLSGSSFSLYLRRLRLHYDGTYTNANLVVQKKPADKLKKRRLEWRW
jgi:hypothetical protein